MGITTIRLHNLNRSRPPLLPSALVPREEHEHVVRDLQRAHALELEQLRVQLIGQFEAQAAAHALELEAAKHSGTRERTKSTARS